MNVAPYEPRHRDGLLGFLREVFPDLPHKSEREYFEWQFDRSPNGSSLATFLLLFDGDRIVGQVGAMRDRLRIGTAWHDCLWLVDLVIHPEARGGSALRSIFKRARDGADLVLATGVAPRILPVYDALNWTRLPLMRSRFCVLRPSRFLALAKSAAETASVGSGPLHALSRLGDHVIPVVQRGRRHVTRITTRGIRIDEVTRFEPAWDADLMRLSNAYEATQYRSARLLNWKFCERPLGKQQVLVVRSPDGDLKAAMVCKWMSRPPFARWLDIADYIAAPGDHPSLRALFDEVVVIANANDLDFVRVRLTYRDHLALLRAPLWLDHTRPAVDDVFVFSRIPGLVDAISKAAWHLTALASDRNETGRDEWVE